LVVQLRLQERSQVRASGAGGAFALELGHRLVLLREILLLDREIDGAVLAVDVDDHRGDRVAFLQVRARVLHPSTRYLGGAEIALQIAAQRNDRAAGIDGLDRPRDDLALLVAREEIVEGVALELLDAQRNTLALDVDREHLRLDLLALLEVAHGFLAGRGPGE